MRLVSVVVPVYNEEKGIERFCLKELFPELKKLENYSLELIFINDGSPDKTLEKLNSLIKDPSAPKTTKIISFSKNFGKEAALTAGFRLAKGDCAISLDSDGQQPPSLIPKFLEKWESGARIVTGVRDGYTKHGLIPRLGSKLFYKLLKMMGNNSTVPGSTDFRLLDRAALDEFNALTEHSRITRGLIDWLGFRQEYIKYRYGTRIAGRPAYNLKKLFRLAIDSFVSMSSTPLVIFGYVGIIITVLSFLLGVFCLINQYLLGDPLGLYWPGAVHMAILITFLVGLVLISQAITAIYISNIYTEAKNRPLYIIDKENSKL
ncbi:glycosyltransferase family 2 protein [Candidatus Saccharibacteria bacterium]|nr:glycosyltransferase family 2 protein [Candidatus Saccharibacteria bacterium]